VVHETSDETSRRQQAEAIQHIGTSARLLAGPGTGKTWVLTQRALNLVNSEGVLPTQILAITFTRAAAQELRGRLRAALGEDAVIPQVSTLHAYALRQLLRNLDQFPSLPKPLRIADDWEQRWIIEEDLKSALGIDVYAVRVLLQQLASDWETLKADESGWEDGFPNPEFIGHWQQHRQIYGYTLRSELVYQLKRALDQYGGFELDGIPAHLLVDEYQDLNPCDLAVVGWLRTHGSELYGAGDDDQSIYGFRNAYPVGIRRFTQDIIPSGDLRLEVCRRCDAGILELADFVIRTDTKRVAKRLIPEDGRGTGDVRLARFADQNDEAAAIASKARSLVDAGTQPGEILILLRQDRNRQISSVIVDALKAQGLPVHADSGGGGPFDTTGGRKLLALLRLAVDEQDSLAWRTLLKTDTNGIGEVTIRRLHDAAVGAGRTVGNAMITNLATDELGADSARIRAYCEGVLEDVKAIRDATDTSQLEPDLRAEALALALHGLARPTRVEDNDEFHAALADLLSDVASRAPEELRTLVTQLGTTREDEEQVVDPNAINVLSMHKAKGLGKDVVFIAAAEDEFLPAGQDPTPADVDDERRLFYVSLTRAKHALYITYCQRRRWQQAYLGRHPGAARREARTLTRFLAHGPLAPTTLD